jgi:hypothetical protein
VGRQIDELSDEYIDAQVAGILNESELRTGACDAFDPIRFSAKLKRLKERLLEAGMLTVTQLSAKLDISRTTIGKLLTQGRLKACICSDAGEWLYWPWEQIPPPAISSTDPIVTSTAI